MLAVGAIVMGKSKFIIISISIIAILQMIIIWIPVIYYRALLVDFHKFNFQKLFDKNGDLVKNLTVKRICLQRISIVIIVQLEEKLIYYIRLNIIGENNLEIGGIQE